jgi:UDP-N-acetylglucosamine 3-dehydrogenase
MPDLSIAVVGCGPTGNIHLAAWAAQFGVRLAAVCDLDPERLTETAGRVPGSAAFVDYRDLLQSEAFDIVDICTPAETHAEIASLALRSGAHVICEKPLTVDPPAAYALVRLADERERLLMPAFCHRFHPPVLFAKELVDNDDIGRPVQFRCRFSGLWNDAPQVVPADGAIGAILDTAIHGVDLFRHFCGEVRTIDGKFRTVNPDLPVEDTAVLLMESETGAFGTVEVSWSLPGSRSVVEIYGTAGACIVDYDTETVRFQTADSPFWRTHEEGGANRFEREVGQFADAVRGVQPLLVTAFDGARAVELCASVLQS